MLTCFLATRILPPRADDGTGFVRLALVPVDQMHDKAAHDKFAFQFLCMNEGPHTCPDRSYDVCGNDFEGQAWQARVQIPTSYPDGVYVFGWSWYGGGNYLDKSFFGDYYSCSYVEIRGGVPVTEYYEPRFPGGTCRSATDRLGVCWSEPCHVGNMHDMIPAEFNNRRPAPIRSEWLGGAEKVPAPGTSVTLGNGASASAGGGSGGGSGDGDRPFVSASSGSSTSGTGVSLGARSGGEGREDGSGGGGSQAFLNGGSGAQAGGGDAVKSGSGGSLGVFFLDFKDWSKKEIRDGAWYRLADYPNGLTVEAFFNGAIQMMSFYLDDQLIRKEKSGPFVMNGNKGRLIHGWVVPLGRMIKLRVVAKSRSGHVEEFKASFRFD